MAANQPPPPDYAQGAHPSASASWRRFPVLVREDANLRAYLIAVALATCAGAAAAFYVVDAKRTFALSDAEASLFAVLLLVASTAGSVLWGYVGDHRGHRLVVIAGAACTGGAALIALGARQAWAGVAGYCAVFALVGFGSSALQLASLTFIVDFAPPAQRPTYIGVAMLAQAPFAFGAPVLAASVANRYDYGAVFALAAIAGLLAMLVVGRYVHDPRTHVSPV